MVAAAHNLGDSFFNNFVRWEAVKTQEKEIKKRALSILERLGIKNQAYRNSGTLSLGNQKLVCLGMLMMNDSQLLMLDEPFSNLHPNTIEKISLVLLELKHQGKSILMIEHKINDAKRISDYFFEIQKQKIQPL